MYDVGGNHIEYKFTIGNLENHRIMKYEQIKDIISIAQKVFKNKRNIS